jgi:hypothetical protein
MIRLSFRSNSNQAQIAGNIKGLEHISFGQFLKGQNISIAAGGSNYDMRDDLTWTNNDPWQLNIEGPGCFQQLELDGVLYAKLLASGNMWSHWDRADGARGERLSYARPIRV